MHSAGHFEWSRSGSPERILVEFRFYFHIIDTVFENVDVLVSDLVGWECVIRMVDLH